MKKGNEPPKHGDIIIITSRNCSEKVSPLVKVGSKFLVKELKHLSNGSLVAEVVHPVKKKSVLRVNEERFQWRIYTEDEAKEEAFRKAVDDGANEIKDKFDIDDQIKITFVPLVYSHLAWSFAMKARRMSSEEKLDSLKKYSREVDKLRRDYVEELRKDLDMEHLKLIEEETERFMGLFSSDFMILYYTVNGEIKKKIPDIQFEYVRTNAALSMLMIKLVDDHNKQIDKMLEEKLGKTQCSVRMPIMDSLNTVMSTFSGDARKVIFGNSNIDMGVKIIENRVRKIEFNIVD